MKIVVGVVGSRGDVQPMFVLARALLQAGHEVTVAGPEDFLPMSRMHGVPFHVLCESFEAMLGRNRDDMRGLMRGMRDNVAQQLETLPVVARRADLIVNGSGLFAGPSVAEAMGAAYRSVLYFPGTIPSAWHASPGVSARGLPRLLNRLLWLGNDVTWQRLAGQQLDAWRKGAGLRPGVRAYRDKVGPRPIVAADPLLAPLPRDLVGRVEQVGAILQDEPQPLPAELEAFLEAGEPPVYIGFGSMLDTDPARTTREVLEAVRRLGVRALLSRGWSGLGGGRLPEGVLAIGPLSHQRLLPHLRAMVHHGGAGTTHAAARAGVPQLIVPHLYDQFSYGARVQALGVGPAPLPKKKLDASRLTEALRACLAPQVKQRAVELSARLRPDGTRELVTLLTGETDTPWKRSAA